MAFLHMFELVIRGNFPRVTKKTAKALGKILFFDHYAHTEVLSIQAEEEGARIRYAVETDLEEDHLRSIIFANLPSGWDFISLS